MFFIKYFFENLNLWHHGCMNFPCMRVLLHYGIAKYKISTLPPPLVTWDEVTSGQCRIFTKQSSDEQEGGREHYRRNDVIDHCHPIGFSLSVMTPEHWQDLTSFFCTFPAPVMLNSVWDPHPQQARISWVICICPYFCSRRWQHLCMGISKSAPPSSILHPPSSILHVALSLAFCLLSATLLT